MRKVAIWTRLLHCRGATVYVAIAKYNRNSVIRNFSGQFFTESIFCDEPVLPDGVRPVGGNGIACKEGDEIHGRESVLVPVPTDTACVVDLCGIFDATPEEVVLAVTLEFYDELRPVVSGTAEVEPDAFVCECKSGDFGRGVCDRADMFVRRECDVEDVDKYISVPFVAEDGLESGFGKDVYIASEDSGFGKI